MKAKIYFIISMFFVLSGIFFYLPMTSLNFSSEVTTNGINNKEEKYTPQLSLTIAWENNGTVICNEDTQIQQYPQICSDGAGGAIITWQDRRNGNFDIYAQKISKTGGTEWDANGTVICNEDTKDQYNPQICSDEDGGAIITWEDYRNGDNLDIYAQKINKTGGTEWTKNGTVICNDTKDQGVPQICSDEDGGAIITWYDNNYDIYAQKINKTGGTEWTKNGTVICNYTQVQEGPQICSDEDGGAIITWNDLRSGIAYDIYAQKINKTGGTEWGDGSFWGVLPDRNGTAICERSGTQKSRQICGDGAGGAIITWQDDINGFDYDIYAQKINTTGYTVWTKNGIVICNETQDQEFPQICRDETGGAIITWEDNRNGVNDDIYAQKINKTGGTEWTKNGTVICNEDTKDQERPQICSDGVGGAIITWEDNRTANLDIYAQTIASDGSILGDLNGTVICNEDTQDQENPQICSDGAGGAIITWQDNRPGINLDDIYAQRIKRVSGGRPTLGLPSAGDDDDDDDDDEVAIPGYPIIFLMGITCLIILYISKRFQKKLKSIKST